MIAAVVVLGLGAMAVAACAWGARYIALHHYGVTITGPSFRFGPAPFKAGVPAVPARTAARVPERRAEHAPAAPVPQGGVITRAKAAALLGVTAAEMEAREGEWGIRRAGTKSNGSVLYDAGSVTRCVNDRRAS